MTSWLILREAFQILGARLIFKEYLMCWITLGIFSFNFFIIDSNSHPLMSVVLCQVQNKSVYLSKPIFIFYLKNYFILFYFIFLIFWLRCVARGILAPRPGMEPVPL